ncbi:C39 family peptidase [Cerasicoccus maritimus]|uniref:C39 family peptidase n=1 Tax=Cerasicoccus maritimus TaxID=490089 RepID=UPI00285250C2|nr:C39 family peptidase [Cerasicoccus maritimus]
MKSPLLLTIITSISLAPPLQARTFTDTQGRTMEAEIVSYDSGDSVTIKRSDGLEFSLPLNKLSAADQDYIRQWKTPEAPTAKIATANDLNRINKIVGAELFADGNLWDDAPGDAAQRLGWPQESQTATQSSYRIYNKPNDRLFGARPFSSVLYGKDGRVDMISIIFANKGDSISKDTVIGKEAIKQIADAIARDGDTISKQLAALGEPEQLTTATGRNLKERLHIWEWSGHVFTLAVQDGEYVALRIIPPEQAANRGRPERIASSALREQAKANLDKRTNGDVVITNIPMVNQGPKGYCVPATLERVLRYMGVSADMYLLAMAGQTEIGGGTRVSDLINGTEGYLKSAGREMERKQFKLKARSIAKYIDDGQPILWTLYSTREFNDLANSNTQARSQYDNAEAWKKALKEKLRSAPELIPNRETAHICMIIGYNSETDEIAISDSWGPQYAERWVPAEQAEQVSQGGFWIVDF